VGLWVGRINTEVPLAAIVVSTGGGFRKGIGGGHQATRLPLLLVACKAFSLLNRMRLHIPIQVA
jgi:hypothetical protein